MTKEEKQELYENICNDISCGTYILAPQYVDKLLAKLEKKNAELIEKLKPENCLKLLAKDGYVKFTSEQLTKAKELLNMFLRLHYNPIVDEHTLFCKVEQFLKETEE